MTEERYRLLVEHSPDAICVHQGGRLLYINAAGLRWMRATSSDQLVGRFISEFVAPESIAPTWERAAGLREIGDRSEPSIVQVLRLDGSRLDVEAVSVLTLWEGAPAFQVTCRDVSAQRRAEVTLRTRAALVKRVSDAIIAIDESHLVTSWNPAAEAIYGRSAQQALGMPVVDAVGAELGVITLSAPAGVVHTVHHAADGTALDVRVSVARVETGFVLVCCDLTALRRAEQDFATVVESLEHGVIVLDNKGLIKSVNPAATKILDVGPEHLGLDFFTVTSRYPVCDEDGKDIPVDGRPAKIGLRTGEPFSDVTLGRDHGRRGWVKCSGRLLNPDHPGQSDMLISFSDVTAQRAAADQLLYRATHDPLTGLPNRAFVLTKITDSLDGPGPERLHTVVFIDLDDLKATNDTLGHKAGDDLLCAAADRLREVVGPGDVVGRLGGDEFVVLIFGAMTHDDVGVADRLNGQLARPVAIDSTHIPIRASIGVVDVDVDDQRTAEEILRDADAAMYAAKRASRRRSE